MTERIDGIHHFAIQERPAAEYYWSIRRKSDDESVSEENYGPGCEDTWEQDVREDIGDRDAQARHFLAQGIIQGREERDAEINAAAEQLQAVDTPWPTKTIDGLWWHEQYTEHGDPIKFHTFHECLFSAATNSTNPDHGSQV